MRQIYADPEDLNGILYYYGTALTGTAPKNQKILILLGNGSTGKSTIMKLLKTALTKCYFKEMASDAFSASNQSANKDFADFVERQGILLI